MDGFAKAVERATRWAPGPARRMASVVVCVSILAGLGLVECRPWIVVGSGDDEWVGVDCSVKKLEVELGRALTNSRFRCRQVHWSWRDRPLLLHESSESPFLSFTST